MKAKTLVGEQVRGLLRRRGWTVEKPAPHNDARARRAQLLRSLGITTVLDVGANVGRYGRELREFGYRGRIVSLEPLSAPYAQLRAVAAEDPRWEADQLALGDHDGTAEINVAGDDVWSSLLAPSVDAPRREWLATTRTETVRTARLDSLSMLGGAPAWLKLDVQGFELHVLRGAEASLRLVAGMECEMSLESFYDGQPAAHELIGALAERGFRLVAVANGYVRPDTGRAMWIDGLFVRDPAAGATSPP